MISLLFNNSNTIIWKQYQLKEALLLEEDSEIEAAEVAEEEEETEEEVETEAEEVPEEDQEVMIKNGCHLPS